MLIRRVERRRLVVRIDLPVTAIRPHAAPHRIRARRRLPSEVRTRPIARDARLRLRTPRRRRRRRTRSGGDGAARRAALLTLNRAARSIGLALSMQRQRCCRRRRGGRDHASTCAYRADRELGHLPCAVGLAHGCRGRVLAPSHVVLQCASRSQIVEPPRVVETVSDDHARRVGARSSARDLRVRRRVDPWRRFRAACSRTEPRTSCESASPSACSARRGDW